MIHNETARETVLWIAIIVLGFGGFVIFFLSGTIDRVWQARRERRRCPIKGYLEWDREEDPSGERTRMVPDWSGPHVAEGPLRCTLKKGHEGDHRFDRSFGKPTDGDTPSPGG